MAAKKRKRGPRIVWLLVHDDGSTFIYQWRSKADAEVARLRIAKDFNCRPVRYVRDDEGGGR